MIFNEILGSKSTSITATAWRPYLDRVARLDAQCHCASDVDHATVATMKQIQARHTIAAANCNASRVKVCVQLCGCLTRRRSRVAAMRDVPTK